MSEKNIKQRNAIIGLFVVLVIAGIAHGWNMFHFPYYESDEGIYASQAWSLIKEGTLTPYTYWYDHPPLGWIIMSGWTLLFKGDFFYFGESSIDHLRALMLAVHLCTTALIFFITKKITDSTLAAMFAGLFYSVSPLFIYFQRRVLLDNIMILFVMASIASLYVSRIKLRHYIFSAVFLAGAVLTKIPAVIFAPVLAYTVFFRETPVSRLFRSIAWLSVTTLSVSTILLYALLRGELLPESVTGGSHVSFISTFFFQMSRDGGNVPFWHADSDFLFVVHDWLLKDALTVVISASAIIISFFLVRRVRALLPIVLFAVSYLLFLVRGGIVTNFYLIPLIPFLAIIVATVFHTISSFVAPQQKIPQRIIFFICVGSVLMYYGFFASHDYLYVDETKHQVAITKWIKGNVDEESAIIVDAYNLVDLWDSHYINTKTFPNADWFYKVDRDPEIRDDKYHNDWHNIEYIALNHEMLKQFGNMGDDTLVRQAFLHAQPRVKWTSGSEAYIDPQKFISTNGDWGMLYAVGGFGQEELRGAWEQYKEKFIHSYGQVSETSDGITKSEGQAYAMLRSVWMDDHETFKGIWKWTQAHLQYRTDDKLLSQKWMGDHIGETANLTSADQDAALALVMASYLWQEEDYLADARGIIRDLWENSVVQINGRYYMLSTNVKSSLQEEHYYVFNPSHLTPAWYRIFAAVDPEHSWNTLADDTYRILHEIGSMPGNKTYLPPDRLVVDIHTGKLSSAQKYFPRANPNQFGYEAFRGLWHIAIDAQWFQEKEAKTYLAEIVARGMGAGDAHSSRVGHTYVGTPLGESITLDVGYLSALIGSGEKERADSFYQQKFQEKFGADDGYWQSQEYYYRSNWVWFGVGLYTNNLRNIIVDLDFK